MNDINKNDEIMDMFIHLSDKYPNYKQKVILNLFRKFPRDYAKIEDYLRHGLLEEFPSFIASDSLPPDSNGFFSKSPEYLFDSMNSSDASSPVQPTRLYLTSNELKHVSSQRCDLQNLDDEYKVLEAHSDYLHRKALYLGQVIERRKSQIDFPSMVDMEFLESKGINGRSSMLLKSATYANDLGVSTRVASWPVGNLEKTTETKVDQLTRTNKRQIHHSRSRHKSGNDEIGGPPKSEHESPVKFVQQQQHRIGHRRGTSDPINWICPVCDTLNNHGTCSACTLIPTPDDAITFFA